MEICPFLQLTKANTLYRAVVDREDKKMYWKSPQYTIDGLALMKQGSSETEKNHIIIYCIFSSSRKKALLVFSPPSGLTILDSHWPIIYIATKVVESMRNKAGSL